MGKKVLILGSVSQKVFQLAKDFSVLVVNLCSSRNGFLLNLCGM